MNIDEAKTKVNIALEKLKELDEFLLVNDVSERSITHKFAIYISELFPDCDVDCEYNSNIQSDNGRKYIYLIKQKAEELGLIRESDGDSEDVLRIVYPDIIVHKRGVNDRNILIIEVKKSSSQVSSNYDHEKLARYTSPEYGNELNYKYGVFIEIGVKEQAGNNNAVEWFERGHLVE